MFLLSVRSKSIDPLLIQTMKSFISGLERCRKIILITLVNIAVINILYEYCSDSMLLYNLNKNLCFRTC